MMEIKIRESLRTCKDLYYINLVRNVLWGWERYQRKECVIGIFSNHSSIHHYALMTKKEFSKRIKEEKNRVSYPKLNYLCYYDLDWLDRKIKRLENEKENKSS